MLARTDCTGGDDRATPGTCTPPEGIRTAWFLKTKNQAGRSTMALPLPSTSASAGIAMLPVLVPTVTVVRSAIVASPRTPIAPEAFKALARSTMLRCRVLPKTMSGPVHSPGEEDSVTTELLGPAAAPSGSRADTVVHPTLISPRTMLARRTEPSRERVARLRLTDRGWHRASHQNKTTSVPILSAASKPR